MRALINVLVAAAVALSFYTVGIAEVLQAFLPALPAFLVQGDHYSLCTVPLLASYLSQEQCAEQLGVTRRTLWLWRKKRTGPPVTMVGGAVMYRIEAVQQWLLSRETKMVRERSRARQRTDRAEARAP